MATGRDVGTPAPGHVAGVTLGIQSRQVQLVRRRDVVAQAQAGGPLVARLCIGRVDQIGARVKTIALLTSQAQGVVPVTGCATHPKPRFLGVKGAYAQLREMTWRAGSTPGKDLHHAAHGVGAIDRAGRAAQHFDAFDLRQWHQVPGRAAAQGQAVL